MKNVTLFKERSFKKYDFVSVHRNLRTGGLSIKRGGIVCGHTEAIYLKNVSFKVSQTGNEKTRQMKQKNVHAHVCGQVILAQKVIDYESRYKFIERSGYKRVRYNPYLFTEFVYYEDNKPVYEAREAYIMKDRIYVK